MLKSWREKKTQRTCETWNESVIYLKLKTSSNFLLSYDSTVSGLTLPKSTWLLKLDREEDKVHWLAESVWLSWTDDNWRVWHNWARIELISDNLAIASMSARCNNRFSRMSPIKMYCGIFFKHWSSFAAFLSAQNPSAVLEIINGKTGSNLVPVNASVATFLLSLL